MKASCQTAFELQIILKCTLILDFDLGLMYFGITVAQKLLVNFSPQAPVKSPQIPAPSRYQEKRL